MRGTIFRIARYAVHDGPGIRTTVFLKGCPLRCWWCHSPESQSPKPELMIQAERCVRCGTCLPACPNQAIEPAEESFATDRETCEACGTCVRACPSGAREIVGTTLTVDQLMAEIEKDVVFFDESGGGVTFSGGEPLMQPDFLDEALRRCQAIRIHTAVDTCGLADTDALLESARTRTCPLRPQADGRGPSPRGDGGLEPADHREPEDAGPAAREHRIRFR
jgi:pyruvate formate lyase activating enzyme